MYDSQKGHYVQSFFEGDTNVVAEKKYLYRNEFNDEWQVGPVSGGEDVWYGW